MSRQREREGVAGPGAPLARGAMFIATCALRGRGDREERLRERRPC